MKVDVTPEAIGARLRTQDNLATSHPLYVVEKRRRHYFGGTAALHYPCAWLDEYGCEASEEEAKELQAKYDETGDEPEPWTYTEYLDTWEFVQAFLTQEAAAEYVKSNAHNLGVSRVFVYSGYRNYEMQAVRAHLAGPGAASGA